MKVLVTGGTGLLGQALLRAFGHPHRVISPTHAELDITEPARLREALRRHQPELVIHAAGIADVDRSEQDPASAYRVNVLGTQHIAQACGQHDIPLVFISSDYVFDGAQSIPYIEFDEPHAINVYGRTKIAAERAVAGFCRRHYIVRTAWLFAPWGNNFLTTTLARAHKGETIRAVSDQHSSPTAALDLANGLAQLVREPNYGVYHMVNGGSHSRYEMAQAICRAAELDADRVVALSAVEAVRPAPRPSFTALRNFRLELMGQNLMRSFEQALAESVAALQSSEPIGQAGRTSSGPRILF